MPRGRRKGSGMSIDEQLQDVRDQITMLKRREKDLMVQKEQNDVNILLEAVKASGKTPAELVAELAAKKSEAVSENE